MSDSQKLFVEYAKSGSEVAFRKLLNGYVDLVYSTAFRLVGRDRGLAEDVAQTVFLDLSQKAKTLPANVMLGGWLHRNTCFVAAKTVRSERRRQERERQAVEMNALMNDSGGNFEEVAPILDEAINQLEPEDRAAVLLRFYERQDFRSVGQAVGTSEDGARMRVNRALEKLHGLLRQKGETLSATALGTALTIEAVTAAPVGLAGKIAATALAGSSTAAGLMGVLGKFATFASGLKLAAVLLISIVAIALVGTYSEQRQPSNKIGAIEVSDVSPASKNAIPRLGPPPGGSRDAGFASAPVSTTDLETAKRELRALLERPQQQTQYAPPQLTVALRRFGAEWLEAIPILLERTDTPDFETRKWALYGLWDMFVNLSAVPGSPAPETQAQALSLARPRLSAILRSPTEPVELRRIAAQTLVPSWALPKISTASGEKFITPPRALDEGTLADMVVVLQSRDKASEGFRFELIKPLLSHQLQSFPDEARTIRDALAPLIEQGNPQQQLFAAYALAAIPGERPPGLREIFVRALDMRGKTDLSYTYRAADALGMLGPEAKDAVPALLKFADAAKSWGTSGYREHALEAACRIQPELRPQYPDIDAKLKQEEAAQRQATAVPAAPREFANLGVALADPEMGTNVLRMLVGQVKAAADPIQKRQELLTELLTLWDNAPDAQREAIQQAITALRAMPDREEGEKPPALSLRALLVDGQVLLLDHKTTNELALRDLFNQWDTWYREHPADSSLIRERFSELSQAIKKVDADFQEAWHKEVIKSYPNLDRVVVGERP